MDAADELDEDRAGSGGARRARAEDGEGEEHAETGAGVRLEQEQDALSFLERLRGAQRREDALVDGVVEEQDLGRLDHDAREGQQVVVHEEADAAAEDRRDRADDGREAEVGADREDRAEDAGGEVVDQHLEAGADPVDPEPLDDLEQVRRERARDHGAEEHRAAAVVVGLADRADDDAHGGDGRDHAAAGVVDHAAAGVRDEQRQHEEQDRRDEGRDVGVRQVAGRDEEGREQAPGDERRDVRHDHAAEERAELLHAEPHGLSRAAGG